MDTQTSEPTPRQGLRQRPWLLGGLVVAALVVLGVVWFWFQPQTLLFDTVVDEQFPTVEPSASAEAASDVEADDAEPPVDEAAAAVDDGDAAAGDEPAGDDVEVETGEPGEASEPEAPTGPIALATGSFESRNRYTVTGTATYFELEDGSRTLRLEDFESTNGPDLYVYLTSADSADSDEALDDDVIDLGLLTGNIGNQNYAIPDDVDLERYDTVVIWCLRFTVGFGAADLVPA